MQKNWTHPRDFSKAVKTNGKWSVDTILRLYRQLNPTISRADATEAFISLGLTQEYPLRPEEPHAYPVNFAKAVRRGKWDMKKVLALYKELGVCANDAHYHFQSLNLDPHKPFLHAIKLPANLFHEKATGFIYLPGTPYPDEIPEDILNMPKQPKPKWFKYLERKLGKDEAYLLVAYNLREYYG